MALYSIFLQTDTSLFPPLELSLDRTSNFPLKAVALPGMLNKMNPIPTLSSTEKCPK